MKFNIEEMQSAQMLQFFLENYTRFRAPYDVSKVNSLETLVFDKINESGLAKASLKEHLQ